MWEKDLLCLPLKAFKPYYFLSSRGLAGTICLVFVFFYFITLFICLLLKLKYG